MASIARDPGGRKRLLFVGADGIRKVIRLGKGNDKTALAVKIKVEALAAAKFMRGTIDDEVSRWLLAIPDELHAKLAAAGLVEPRAASQCVTLAELLGRYQESRTGSIKPSTILVHDQARQSLLEYFGGNRPVKDIHEGDAELWAAGMVKQGLAEATRQRIVASSPFTGLKSGAVGNDQRLHFVSQEDFQKVVDEATDSEWRLILALARYGGLRVSEIFALRWQDVCWDKNRILVHSVKTEGHEGHGTRQIPIFKELSSACWPPIPRHPREQSTALRGIESPVRTSAPRSEGSSFGPV